MRASAIICEFNPFHNGHAHIIREMKKYSDVVVCIMSGCFVQRGEAAIASPYLRAQIAAEAGADLVLELPFPYSASSAESFAEAGVNIAARLGCDTLFFGSECGDISLLERAAEVTLTESFAQCYTELSKTTLGTTAAYTRALEMALGEQKLQINANDLLGISYIRAIKKHNYPLSPAAILRLGDGYNAETVSGGGYPSATALRKLICAAAEDTVTLRAVLDGTMDGSAVDRIVSACDRLDMPTDMDRLGGFIHAYYRLADEKALENCAEMTGGLAAKLCRTAKETISYQDFFSALRNKHHTDAHLRRAILFGIIGVKRDDLLRAPDYTTLLASSGKGREFLRSIRKSSQIAIITKPASAHQCPQTELSKRAEALFTLTLPKPRDGGYMTRLSPFVCD